MIRTFHMTDLINDLERAKAIADTPYDNWEEGDAEFFHIILMRFARFLPSPSKLNAASVIKSNSAEKLVRFLEYYEATLQ